MCGRTIHTLSDQRIARVANTTIDRVTVTERSYNASPTHKLPVIYHDLNENVRCVKSMTWGLKPRFKTETNLLTNNARSEHIIHSKLYSPLLQKRRCVVIVDGFYEWKTENTSKRPFLIRFHDKIKESRIPNNLSPGFVEMASKSDDEYLPKEVLPLLMAGLYDDIDGESSFTIVTMDSVGLMQSIHERMPLFLTTDEAATWLDLSNSFNSIFSHLLEKSKLHSLEKLLTFEVSPLVNSVRNQGPDCVFPKSVYDNKQFNKGLGKFFSKIDKNEYESSKSHVFKASPAKLDLNTVSFSKGLGRFFDKIEPTPKRSRVDASSSSSGSKAS